MKLLVSLVLLATVSLFIIVSFQLTLNFYEWIQKLFFLQRSQGQDFRKDAGLRRRDRDSCEGSRRSTTTTATTSSTSRNSCSRKSIWDLIWISQTWLFPRFAERSAQDCAQFLNAELRRQFDSSADYRKIKYIRALIELNSRQISGADDFTSADLLFWKNLLDKLGNRYVEKCPAPELV